MGLFDFLKKEAPKGPDPTQGLTLAKMKPGYMVDYDLKTWEVAAYHYYDWGKGDITHEWQLRSSEETVYLERESDDEEEWSLNRKIDFGLLGPRIKQHILDHDDPPDEINFQGTTYYLSESGAGHFFKDGRGQGQPFIKWDYEDDSGEKYLTIEQWGEEAFEATAGQPVHEYQFTNILPR